MTRSRYLPLRLRFFTMRSLACSLPMTSSANCPTLLAAPGSSAGRSAAPTTAPTGALERASATTLLVPAL
ncbi:hypothetical protein PF010_g10937 [Phytophthora fragariae]|uniref:RxLR effector protein n=1 Tax=Phytophthora fragariae TaxID=53985 RepID=A0A6A3EVF2_9STRA|nr:hypothetical protein PF003_g11257 [Phytophthora fragariae]KAE8937444.1 hypothetical protein PF009_g12651 [Phytophthora fragariae]KAE9073969.1 hypothetical protein PF007_g25597 [Phytophthora fragariae]KAE9102165.1 hypothetical protein PF006_g22496 [Phytophthora fragariae]KAE9111058.1 hypothetical protein PF010_g10937 [Phytophthora fragariae]